MPRREIASPILRFPGHDTQLPVLLGGPGFFGSRSRPSTLPRRSMNALSPKGRPVFSSFRMRTASPSSWKPGNPGQPPLSARPGAAEDDGRGYAQARRGTHRCRADGRGARPCAGPSATSCPAGVSHGMQSLLVTNCVAFLRLGGGPGCRSKTIGAFLDKIIFCMKAAIPSCAPHDQLNFPWTHARNIHLHFPAPAVLPRRPAPVSAHRVNQHTPQRCRACATCRLVFHHPAELSKATDQHYIRSIIVDQ